MVASIMKLYRLCCHQNSLLMGRFHLVTIQKKKKQKKKKTETVDDRQ